MTINTPPVARTTSKRPNSASVNPKPSHPAGWLAIATAKNKASLSRQAQSGRAIRVPPNVYLVGASLAPQDVVAHHRLAIINVFFWPRAVLSDHSALLGGIPIEGWLFITHPDPQRCANLEMPGHTVAPHRGPSPLPGDMPMPNGLYLSDLAPKGFLVRYDITTHTRPLPI